MNRLLGLRRKGRAKMVRTGNPPQPSQSPRDTDSGLYQKASASFPDGMKVLHECPDATVDVCFVHGLAGDRERTWTAHGHSTSWPQSLLPDALNKARILTYGYDAYVVRKSVTAVTRLVDHATNLLNEYTANRDDNGASSRPIIFVGHSLGGLVCQEAIILSRNNPLQRFYQ